MAGGAVEEEEEVVADVVLAVEILAVEKMA